MAFLKLKNHWSCPCKRLHLKRKSLKVEFSKMKVEFVNFNDDSQLDPEIKEVPLSTDSVNQPPPYCLPWIEANRYSIQLKANFEYWIRKSKDKIEACAVKDGKVLPIQDIYAEVPEGTSFVAKDEAEKRERKISVGHTPSFSSPWQSQKAHSVTLKLGISWWTPPGWGMFFTSAIHRNETFRVVEGFVRTDLWHRDVPIIIQPLKGEIKIPKYSVLATALVLPVEDHQLVNAGNDQNKLKELSHQISSKRLNASFYKILVDAKGRDEPRD